MYIVKYLSNVNLQVFVNTNEAILPHQENSYNLASFVESLDQSWPKVPRIMTFMMA